MENWLAVAGGGALGAMARYGMNRFVTWCWPTVAFPLATLIENALGAYCAGFLLSYFSQRLADTATLRLLLSVGFLGAFTTFSAFSVETVGLLQRGEIVKAGLNVTLNVILSLALCGAGMQLARR